MQSSRPLIPYLSLAAGILALSFQGIFVHWSTAPGVVTTFYRMTIAATVLLPVVVWRVRKLGMPAPALLVFPLLGGLFTALDQGLWSTSIGYTKIANATLLNNIAPLWVVLFASIFWKERMTARFWFGLLLTLAGAGIVLGNDMIRQPHLTVGDGIALGSSFAWAGYYLVTQRGRIFIDTLVYIWMVEFVTAILVGSAAVGLRMPLVGFPPATWLAILGAGLISQVCGHFLLAFALGHLPASIVSPTMISLPVATSILAIPFAGQALAAEQWLGGLTVVVGITLVNISRGQGKKPANLDPQPANLPVEI